MTRKTTRQPPLIENPELLMSHEAAQQKIADRIEKGKELLEKRINSEPEYNEFEKDLERWNDFNKEMLVRMFTTKKIEDDYNDARIGSYIMNQGWQYWLQRHKELLGDRLNKLKAISERLELIPLASSVPAPQVTLPHKEKTKNRKVFVVHGHDDGFKNTVARVLTSMDLEPIILHEQVSSGKTVIEKIELYSEVSFAVVLMSPDDIGYAKGNPEQAEQRARQNVLLELGYFIGKLGRENVGAVYMDGVHIPTDFSGVVYIPFDKNGGWKYLLAKELIATGLQVDMSKIV